MTNIEQLRNAKGEIWVNVASSTYVLDNFINLDNHLFLRIIKFYPFIKNLIPIKYRALVEEYVDATNKSVLLRHDCRKPLPFPNKSVDHLLCSHFLEHVYVDEARKILRDFHRVLRDDGTIHIIVPCLNKLVDKYVTQSKKGIASAADEFLIETLLVKKNAGTLKYRLLEFYGGFGLQHRYMYDYVSMKSMLKEAGFKLIQTNETPSKDYRFNDGSVHVIAYKDKLGI